MIVLDTNVLSELMCQAPDELVVEWMDRHPDARLFTTAVTQAEILYGVSVLPDGRRKQSLTEAVDAMFEQDFHERTLPFDGPAAITYAAICSECARKGRPISQFDAQIAAITRSRGAALATRNTSDFEACEIQVIDPWRGM
ncbi:MAG: type II toxin-antitoxin system VapC family toxin [Gemmatimonadetes bacterium]|jgi:toxin FitB|nr:type II toxin-antitoxin system VapC family toxin [Gemmatimonadota bacterium]MBT6148905.1 type II toxin-antitoxin system VapC family toxin [Gemmatimonadota bacterium]MBT7863565.1 type II toxin-antitoxin system VapC family toxin [Gemmatimonadota bacterium]